MSLVIVEIFIEVLDTINHKAKKSVSIDDYFFYTDEQNQVKIIRYDMYESLWYIGGFEETDFEPQIDIYKSPDSKL